MHNTITLQELKILRKSFIDDRDDLIEYKKRGKGVKHIPKESRHNYILMTYVIHLLDRLISGNCDYKSDSIVGALKKQDWEYYSFADKAFHGKKLFEVLMVSPKDPYDKLKALKQRVELHRLQARYLEDASNIVIQNIESI